jgi:restriction system protein
VQPLIKYVRVSTFRLPFSTFPFRECALIDANLVGKLLLRETAGFRADGKEHKFSALVGELGSDFALTEEEMSQLLPSGSQPVFANRAGWARLYLKKAGLVDAPKRGFLQITDRGRKVLAEGLERIDSKFLERFPDFVAFKSGGSAAGGEASPPLSPSLAPSSTPFEVLEDAYGRIRSTLANELLETLQKVDPRRFEQIVIDLILGMGYGGSKADAGKAIGKSGDEGIDGIIKEDRLGLGVIYVQAKRWEQIIGRPEVQKFAEALAGQHATKGIFITTSSFTKEALSYASSLAIKVVLLDGLALTSLMIDHGIGVTTETAYEIKRIDSDYFDVP